jgi:1-acyl-sn-glycerol-3-phosphate acyltransferase
MSLGHLFYAAAITLRISVPTIVDAMRGRLTPEVSDARLDWWSKRLLGNADVSLCSYGLDQIPSHEAFVVMSNHQSLYDIPALYQSLPLRLRMVAKTELFRVPIWARAMREAGFIELDRSARDRAIASLDRGKIALAQGTSIWIAPEGTRSRDGQLGPFKLGGFHLAAGAGVRILPVTIRGTRQILPAKGARVAAGAAVTVRVHAPIDPAEFAGEVSEPLVSAVRRAIESGLISPDQSLAGSGITRH